MAVSPCTVWCSMDAHAATSYTSPGSLRSATYSQRLVPRHCVGGGGPVERPPFPATASAEGTQLNGRSSTAGPLVRVLEPPVKADISQGRGAHRYPPRCCGAADDIELVASFSPLPHPW